MKKTKIEPLLFIILSLLLSFRCSKPTTHDIWTIYTMDDDGGRAIGKRAFYVIDILTKDTLFTPQNRGFNDASVVEQNGFIENPRMTKPDSDCSCDAQIQNKLLFDSLFTNSVDSELIAFAGQFYENKYNNKDSTIKYTIKFVQQNIPFYRNLMSPLDILALNHTINTDIRDSVKKNKDLFVQYYCPNPYKKYPNMRLPHYTAIFCAYNERYKAYLEIILPNYQNPHKRYFVIEGDRKKEFFIELSFNYDNNKLISVKRAYLNPYTSLRSPC